MSRADRLRIADYLDHILEAIRRIHRYVENMDEVAFLEDPRTQDAVIRNFEIIGEACRNIELHHADFAAGFPEVPWGIAYEMRNALAHGYFKVDLEIVWKTIHADLPALFSQVVSIKDKLN
jgi:uncharacterized protein with HEPN domain